MRSTSQGALFGIGTVNGPVFAGTDAHGLWLTDADMDLVAREVPRGVDFTTGGVEHTGRGERTIWDYRVMEWIVVDAYLFDAE